MEREKLKLGQRLTNLCQFGGTENVYNVGSKILLLHLLFSLLRAGKEKKAKLLVKRRQNPLPTCSRLRLLFNIRSERESVVKPAAQITRS